MVFASLLAAGNDWVVAFFAILVPAAIWVLNWLVGQFAQEGQQPPARNPRPEAPQPEGGAPRDEVQEFLRKVRERRREAEGVEVLRPPPQPEPEPKPIVRRQQSKRPSGGLRDRPPSRPARQAQSTRPAPRPQSPLAAAPQPTYEELTSRIGDQVAKDIDTSSMAEQSSHLTQLDQADEQMEAHLQSVFSHSLGQLRESAPDEATAARAAERLQRGSLAAAVRAQLTSPASVRQAVVIREILDRPTHRW